MSKQQYGFITEPAVVMEMSNDGVGEIDVPVEDGLVAKLTDGDNDPMFVTIEVINEGVSRNGRAYDRSTIESLAEQINANKPDGYYGHLTDEERKTKFPEPQTIWIGAKVEEVGGKTRLFAKGYVLPEAKSLRSYLRKAKAAGKNVAVSVYGLAQVVRDKTSNLVRVNSMSLESIDWARSGSEGVLNMGLFSVTSEMAEDSKIIEQGETMDRVEVLKSLTAQELKENNPTVIKEMISEAVYSIQEEYTDVVLEMADVRAALSLKDDVSTVETIKEMTSRLHELELDAELRDKVESATARKIVKQLVVAEMSDEVSVTQAVDKVLGSETGQAVIKEMLDIAPRIAPTIEQPSIVARKFTKKG